MLGGRQTGLIKDRIYYRIFFITFSLILVFALSTAYCAQSSQNNDSNAPVIQDSNSVIPVVPDTVDTDIAADLTIDQLQEKKKKISDSTELNDELKSKISEVYDQTITYLKQAIDFEGKIQTYSSGRKNANADLEKAKEQLAGQTAFTAPEVAEDITLTQAEQKLTEATLALEQARKNAAYWENEPKRRTDRRAQIPEETNTAKQKLDDIQNKIASAKVEAKSSELAQANLDLLAVQKRALEAQIEANTQELLFYDARKEILSAQRDLASRQLSSVQKRVEFWQQKVNELRIKEAQAAQKEAKQAQEQTGTSTPEIIQKVIGENVKLTTEQTNLADKIEKTSQYLKQIDEQLTSIKNDFEDIQKALETAGKVTDVMGVRLLTKRSELPNTQQNRQRIKSRLAEISDAYLNYFQYDKEWAELNNTEQYADSLIDKTGPPLLDAERQTLILQLQNKRKTLESLKDLYLTYSQDLQDLDSKERGYVRTVREYAEFIDANILWVKSSSTFNLKSVPEIWAALKWLVSAGNWQETMVYLWSDLVRNSVFYFIIIVLFAFLLILHRKMHGVINTLSKKVIDISSDSFLHTIKAFILTILLAVTWPILFLFLQWRLMSDTSGADFIQALAGGLRYLATGIFVFELIRHLTMPSGLMSVHFRIREDALVYIRRHVRWFFAIIIPLMFIFRILQVQQSDEVYYYTAGRFVFILMLIFLGVFLLWLIRLSGPLTGPYIKRYPEGWIGRLRYVWYPLCLILPAGFALVATMGYFYAARYLYEKFLSTLALVLLVVFFKAMLTRWLLVTRKRLALIERQKREAAAQEELKETKDETITATEVSRTAQSKTDSSQSAKPEKTIFEISKQTTRLINAIVFVLMLIGLWYVWRDVLPALGALGNFEIWKTKAAPGMEPEIITLGNLVMALLVVIITVIVARNVPGLLEIVVLRKLPIDAGVRFAITTVCRYIIVIVGVIYAFSQIGIGWSKVQWLIAAMTVGLGFGLQEIFANFISGLIILFEQPVRVNDVVTVGEVTGTVTKIKIRATTIRKWDQRELVVPNKEFITGRLINWTLSDKVLRRDFVVGIAYGSDIVKAEKTLYEIARANPMVLEDPKPVVLFKTFGDSSLEFELRVYIAGIENYLPVWHNINCAIDDAFRKVGIEIAFPQQDLHIRSVKTNIPVDLNKPPEFA